MSQLNSELFVDSVPVAAVKAKVKRKSAVKKPKDDVVDWDAFFFQFKFNPVAFVEFIWPGMVLDQWQKDVLMDIANGTKFISVRAGHRVGKSTVASFAIIHFLVTRSPMKCIVSAPSYSQLHDALISEIKSWIAKLPKELHDVIGVNQDRIWYKDPAAESFVTIVTAGVNTTQALAGKHSENVLIILDEASDIPEMAFNSLLPSMSAPNATMLLIGNPVHNYGFFYDSHMGKSADKWKKYHVPSLGNPRVGKDYIDFVIAKEGIESAEYQYRILGNFPVSDANALIGADAVDLAMRRTESDVPLDTLVPLTYGVDIARMGDDKCVLIARRGSVITRIEWWNKVDLMETCGKIMHFADKDHPDEICVDSIGVGGGVADRLRELKMNCKDINVAERAAMDPNCARLRDDIWFQCKTWIESRNVRIPYHERLRQDLLSPTYTYESNGKRKVEGKDSIKKRLKASPDFADALCLTFAGTAASIGGRATTWVPGVALKRGIKNII